VHRESVRRLAVCRSTITTMSLTTAQTVIVVDVIRHVITVVVTVPAVADKVIFIHSTSHRTVTEALRSQKNKKSRENKMKPHKKQVYLQCL